jgi:hypothetical protein
LLLSATYVPILLMIVIKIREYQMYEVYESGVCVEIKDISSYVALLNGAVSSLLNNLGIWLRCDLLG